MKIDELENAHRIVMAGVYGEKSSGLGKKTRKKDSVTGETGCCLLGSRPQRQLRSWRA